MRGVVAFAAEVGVTVVAEGVERFGELEALVEIGCREAQGYLFSRPVPTEQIEELLASDPRWLPASASASGSASVNEAAVPVT